MKKMRRLPNGTYQVDGIDIVALVVGPILILSGFVLSSFFLFAGIALLLLTTWAHKSLKIIAIGLAIFFLFLLGLFDTLLSPVLIFGLLFGGYFISSLVYLSFLPLIFTGAVSIFGSVCAVKNNNKLANAATISFFIFALITAILIVMPSMPYIDDLQTIIWAVLANYVVLQFAYIIVFSMFYYAVYFAHRTGKHYLVHLKYLSEMKEEDSGDETLAEEQKRYAEIFGPASSPYDLSQQYSEDEE
jgi:MFS family permease